MASARRGGTALPIWRAVSTRVPHQTKSSGNDWIRAASQWVIDRLTHRLGSVADHSGCSTRPYLGFQNSVRIVRAGASPLQPPITSDLPVGLCSQQGGSLWWATCVADRC